MNPKALNVWVLCTAVGYVVHGEHGAAIGLAAASALTLLVNLFG